jgi:hypothetical protein
MAGKQDSREWRQRNKEHLNEYKNEWSKINRDKINKHRREWVKNNPEKKKAQHRRYNTSLKGRYNTTKGAAKRRGKTFTLTFEQFCAIISAPCIYCKNELGHKSTTGSGLDRLDNSIGYEFGNVQSCCGSCNQIKGEILTVEETKAAVNAILQVRKITCDK